MSSLFHLDMFVTFLLTVTTFEVAKAGVVRLYRRQQAKRWKRTLSDRLLDERTSPNKHGGYLAGPPLTSGIRMFDSAWNGWRIDGNEAREEAPRASTPPR